MNKTPWYLNPISIFIYSIIAVVGSLILYIYWSMKTQIGIEKFISKFNLRPDPLLETNTWVTIVTLSLLFSVIVLGLIIIFVYYYKSMNLYRLQNNFINNFTHELKTPLTSLNLFLDTFKNHELNRAEQLKYINFMREDTSRLSTVVQHILSTAKIESQTYQTKFEETDLVAFTKTVVESQKRLTEKVKVILLPNSDSFVAPFDLALIEMFITNLLTNAIKYNESNEIVVTIEFVRSNKWFDLRISDNGIGIEKKDLKNIFKKFYQVGKSIDMSAKGSGIGLFLVQTIASLHKSKVLAESEGVGNGSTFIFRNPLGRELNNG